MSGISVAVIVAHPDDEVLAFGGAICRHAEAGDAVHVQFLSTGIEARFDAGAPQSEAIDDLRVQARRAGELLGVASHEFCDFPDNRMDTVPLLDVVKRVNAFVVDKHPEIVYTHHIGDLNIDHAITARAVLTACRPVPDSNVRRIYAGEILSSSEYALSDDRFTPTTYIGIEPYIDRKREALQCYEDELRYWPHPRSIKAVAILARLRGSEVGLEAAEAFRLMREIKK